MDGAETEFEVKEAVGRGVLRGLAGDALDAIPARIEVEEGVELPEEGTRGAGIAGSDADLPLRGDGDPGFPRNLLQGSVANGPFKVSMEIYLR